MSKPPTLELPPGAQPLTLDTPRGPFAAHLADPPSALGTALLVPGFTGSKEDFIALLAPLAAAGWRVVAVDPRGQFETPPPPDPATGYLLPELAADLVGIAETVRRTPDETVHLLGHSFGGLVARAAALRADAVRVWRSLTLLSSGPGGVDEGDAARLGLLQQALQSMALPEIWEAMRRLDGGGVVAADDPDDAIAAFLRRRFLANDPRCLAVTGRQLVEEPDRVKELSAVALPMLVASGTEDAAWPVPWQDAMAARLGAQRLVVAGSGHSPNAERPTATARALDGFWRSCS